MRKGERRFLLIDLARKKWGNTSFSYSYDEDGPILDEIDQIATEDGVSFSQVVMQQLKQVVHERKSRQPKEQSQLDPFVKNLKYIPFPDIPSATRQELDKFFLSADFKFMQNLDPQVNLFLKSFNEHYRSKQREAMFNKPKGALTK